MSNAYADMDIPESGGIFLKVKGGESVDIHILSTEPMKKIVHGWGKNRTSCMGERCHDCDEGAKPKTRWMINILDRKDNSVKIYEFGAAIARQIRDIADMLREDGKTIHDIDLRIKAEGTGKETEYTVMNRPAGPVPEGLVLHELK